MPNSNMRTSLLRYLPIGAVACGLWFGLFSGLVNAATILLPRQVEPLTLKIPVTVLDITGIGEINQFPGEIRV